MLGGSPVGIFDWLSFLLGVVAVFVYINSLSMTIHMTYKMLSSLFFLCKKDNKLCYQVDIMKCDYR